MMHRTIVCSLAVSLSLCGVADGAVINVPADQPTILGAIGVAVAGDEIVVAPGVYAGAASLMGKAVTLRSADPSDPLVVASTVLDGGGSVRPLTCNSGETAGTVIDGLTFRNGSSGTGGALLIVNASPTVRRCVFEGNSAIRGGAVFAVTFSAPLIEECTFVGNSSSDDGGAITCVNNSSPTVSGCVFDANSSKDGGAVYAFVSSAPEVVSCSFTGNVASCDGGAIACVDGSGPTVTGCVFDANFAVDDGAGLYCEGLSHPSVVDCEFSNNACTGPIGTGGAVHCTLDSAPTFTRCDFVSNSAFNGGAVENERSGPAFLDCTFTGNAAENLGGAVINFFESHASYMGCDFTDNTAESGAGVCNFDLSDAEVIGCTFTNNTCTLSGGGVLNNNGSDATITGCAFTGNAARFGGGIATFNSAPAVSASVFTSNSAEVDGGGIYTFRDVGGADGTIGACDFETNDARFGGALMNFGSAPDIQDCEFISNTASEAGGAVRTFGGGAPVLSGCVFRSNSSPFGGAVESFGSVSTVVDCEFELNTATTSGGAVRMLNDGPSRITGTVFRANSASFGGGVDLITSDVVLERCEFEQNDAVTAGGGLIAAFGGGVEVRDSAFRSNTAAFGSAMRNFESDLTLERVRVLDNIASMNGAIENVTGQTTVQNALIAGNASVGEGGAVLGIAGASTVLRNTTVAMNSAGVGGGAVSNHSSVCTVTNCVVWGNSTPLFSGDVAVVATFSAIQGGFPGGGNVGGNPLFVDAVSGDFRLRPGSPAIDAGNNAALPVSVTQDLDGNARRVDDPGTPDSGVGTSPIIDMGAFEFQGTTFCRGDCDDNGTVDFNDLVSMLFEFGTMTDERCDADSSGTVDFNDLVAALFLFGPCK